MLKWSESRNWSVSSFINGVRTEEASRLHFVRIDNKSRILFHLFLQQLLWHCEELVEVHCAFISQNFLYFFLRLGLLGAMTHFIKIDESVFGGIRIEGFPDLKYLVLIESLIKVLLHLEVLEGSGCWRTVRITHLINKYNSLDNAHRCKNNQKLSLHIFICI